MFSLLETNVRSLIISNIYKHVLVIYTIYYLDEHFAHIMNKAAKRLLIFIPVYHNLPQLVVFTK